MKFERIIFSDASGYAGAGFVLENNNVVHCMWDMENRTKSSTWRELKTVSNVLESLYDDLKGKMVKLYTDNQNVVKIDKKGSMKPELQNIGLHIFHLCLSYNILLEVEWIPRDENFEADFLSKIFDFDDWGISQNIFSTKYGVRSLATHLQTTKTKKYLYSFLDFLHQALPVLMHSLMTGQNITTGLFLLYI